MKNYITLAILLGFASPALARDQDFVLLNQTGYTIEQVYVSASSEDRWEEDVLGRDTLPAGERTKIEFVRNEKACLWDLKVVYDDAETAEWEGVNLCEVSVVKLSYKGGNTYAETD